MLPIKKVLCPTDFSEPANEGVKTANELAMHFSSQLILIHVVATIPYIAVSPELAGYHDLSALTELENAARQTMANDAQRLVDDSVDSQLMVASGNAADEITRVAEEEKVDLIVISTHGLSGWRKFFFGSVTEKVAKSAPCPILLIHPPAEEK